MMPCSVCKAVLQAAEPTCHPTSASRLSRTSDTRQHQPSTQVCANSTDRNLASQRVGRQRKPAGSHVAWEMHARADRPGGPPQPLPPATNAVSVLPWERRETSLLTLPLLLSKADDGDATKVARPHSASVGSESSGTLAASPSSAFHSRSRRSYKLSVQIIDNLYDALPNPVVGTLGLAFTKQNKT